MHKVSINVYIYIQIDQRDTHRFKIITLEYHTKFYTERIEVWYIGGAIASPSCPVTNQDHVGFLMFCC